MPHPSEGLFPGKSLYPRGDPPTSTPADQATRIPKLAIPIEVVGSAFRTVEQGSLDEIRACVYAILATPKGARLDTPEFGVEDPSFEDIPLNLTDALAAIAEWEPEARVEAAQELEDLFSDNVTIGVGTE